MDKNSFVMYTTYAEHINLLTMEQRGLLLTAIMNYASGEPLPDMDGMTRMAFSFIKVQMDRDSEKYQATVEKRRESGKLGGRPSMKANGLSEKAKKANGFSEKQTKAKKPDNDNEYDNDKNVRLIVTKGANVSNSGLDSADSAKLYVRWDFLPEDTKKYLQPKAWQQSAEKESNFTFTGGADFFVEGDTSQENPCEDFFTYMKEKYDNCFKVTNVDDYNLIPHIEVGGA